MGSRRAGATATPRAAGRRHRRRPVLASDHGARYDLAPAASPATTDPVTALVDQLTEALDNSGLDTLDVDELRARLALLTRLQGLTAVATAATVHQLTQAGAVAADGAPSTTAWIAQTTGTTRRQAARVALRASTLPDLPATAAAMAAGQISTDTADVLVATARDGRLGTPTQVETTLLPVAVTERPERLRAEVRRRTQQVDADTMLRDETRQHQRRRLSLTRRDDGMWDLHGLLTAEIGDQARTLLDTFDHPDPQDTPPDQRRRPDQRLADAFATAIGAMLDLGPTPTAGGIARPHVSVIVDLATLDTDLTAPDGGPVSPDDSRWADLPAGQTAWATTLSPQAVRQLCCDANISRIVTTGPSQILDVGRTTRVWTQPQRRAINARDRTCRGPGCDRPIAWTHIHHIQWWRHDGETNLTNGIALCPACHDLIHRRGWHVELDPTTAHARWTPPDHDPHRIVVTRPRPPT